MLPQSSDALGKHMESAPIAAITGMFIGPAHVRRLLVRDGFWVKSPTSEDRLNTNRSRSKCHGAMLTLAGCATAWFAGSGKE